MKDYETTLARALIDAILAKGCAISVYDGEEWVLPAFGDHGTDPVAIYEALGSTDMDVVLAVDATIQPDCKAGRFMLVYGNGPGELIADHTDNEFCNAIWAELEPVMAALESGQ